MSKIKLHFHVGLQRGKDEDDRFPQEVMKTIMWNAVPRTGEYVELDNHNDLLIDKHIMEVKDVVHSLDNGEVLISLSPQPRERLDALQRAGWEGHGGKKR